MEELTTLLDERPADLESGELDVQEQSQPQPASPTVLSLDDWSIRRGRDVLSENEQLRNTYDVPNCGDDPDGWRHTQEGDKYDAASLQVADFLSAAFEPEVKLANNPEDKRRERFLKQLMQTPDYQSLHQETQLDESASEIAAGGFSQQWVTLCHQPEPKDEFDRDLQSLLAAGKAAKDAKADVGDLRDTQAALGLGTGDKGTPLAKEELAKLFRRVRNNDVLRRIADLAGRYRRFAQSQQRKKTLHGQDDLVGVVLGGDLARLMPHELVQLDDPDLELDAMRRLVERQMQCRDYRGLESKARGPICIVVDESGSMQGDPVANAKAIALALAWVARHQKRWCCLVGFSGGEEGNYLTLPPGGWDQAKLLDWLEHFYGAGTDCDVPLVEVPKKWDELGCPKGKTDLVIITDARVDVPPEIAQDFLAWKAVESCKLISLVINNAEAGDLENVSDKLYTMPALSLEAEGVQDILGL